MPATPTVDRERELAVFANLLKNAREGQSSILIIEEASGRGKSRLLHRFKELCHEQVEAWSYVDLVGGSLTPIDILKRMGADLGRVALGNTEAALSARGILNISPSIEDNKTFGSATHRIETSIHVEELNRDKQKQLWSDAAQGFRDDLREYRSGDDNRVVVLLIDTFERAAPESQIWITDHLLPSVGHRRVPGLFIVVAGKNCPKPSGEWMDQCEFMQLAPLTEEHWAEYAMLVGSCLTSAQVSLLYQKHEGAALKMAETVGLFIQR